MTEYSVAILCGGRSTRMGQDKAGMKAGGMRMADRLLDAFSGCGEILLSVRDEEQITELSAIRGGQQVKTLAGMHTGVNTAYVPDPVSGAGPLAGIVASLRACGKDLLFAAAVDLPFLDRAFAEELLRLAEEGSGERKGSAGQRSGNCYENLLSWDAAVPVGPDGRMHPLSAFYRKTCLPRLETCLADGTYRLRDCLAGLTIKKVPVPRLTAGDRKLINLNRPEDVENWLRCLNRPEDVENRLRCLGGREPDL